MRALAAQVLSNNRFVDIYVKIPTLLPNTKMLVIGDDLLKSFYFQTNDLIVTSSQPKPIPNEIA
ncbi:conserved domain protein [Ureaplasma urealyticum serovar 9 str. ATCC 33175]|nr:conserved domain protein [Ureaplasma urealyticum serovar 9 str. ATCC 33175]